MKKVLVVCYSRTGTVLQLGREIAAALGADFEPIEDACERKGGLGYFRSAVEALAKGLPSIRTRVNPAEYDLVIVGTPTWVGTMASPVRSYLFRNREKLREVAFFAAMGGVGADDALREMRAVCSAEEAPSCAFVEREVHGGNHRPRLQDFIARLKRARDGQTAQPSAAA